MKRSKPATRSLSATGSSAGTAPSAGRGPSAAPPPSFASVARRVTGWTTNLIASGTILVLALGLGREIVRWWHVEPARIAPDTAVGELANVDLFGPYTLEFGDSPYTIEQQTSRGDRQQAIQDLLAGCRSNAVRSQPPNQPPNTAENRLLETTASLEPLEVDKGVRYYGPDTGFPLLVGVASVEAAGAAPPAAESAAGRAARAVSRLKPESKPTAGPSRAQLGASRDRVVVWGIAAPAGPETWSLYTFRLGQTSAAALADAPSVGLPPGSGRTMSLRDARGETLLAFAGQGIADEWRRFFAAGLRQAGWSVMEDWQSAGGVWQARYARPSAAGRTTVELQFGPDPGGRLCGLLRVVPAAKARAVEPPASETEREHR